MKDTPSSQRERLEVLWSCVISDKMDQELLEDSAVPRKFLKDQGIRMVPHKFEGAHDFSLGLHVEGGVIDMNIPVPVLPPILFSPFRTFDHHPIRLDDHNPLSRDRTMSYMEYGSPNIDGGSYTTPGICCEFVSHYLRHWAEGNQIPRKVPAEIATLFELRGLKPVHLPHDLFAGRGLDNPFRNGWDTIVYEFDEDHFDGFWPHTILLTAQFNKGHNGSILRGELAVILTAMRNRAHQILKEEEEEEEEDDDDDEDEESDEIQQESKLLFEHEGRFPVLMISCVAPQHARIYYACMNGVELVIRQSRIYSFEKKNTEFLDLFSSILLSSPVGEDDNEVSTDLTLRPGRLGANEDS